MLYIVKCSTFLSRRKQSALQVDVHGFNQLVCYHLLYPPLFISLVIFLQIQKEKAQPTGDCRFGQRHSHLATPRGHQLQELSIRIDAASSTFKSQVLDEAKGSRRASLQAELIAKSCDIEISSFMINAHEMSAVTPSTADMSQARQRAGRRAAKRFARVRPTAGASR